MEDNLNKNFFSYTFVLAQKQIYNIEYEFRCLYESVFQNQFLFYTRFELPMPILALKFAAYLLVQG